MICGSGGSKRRLAKAAGAEPSGQMRDEKVHAVVARSRFRSQNVQNRPVSDHFWKLRRRKSARRCGAKHISKSKCTKHTILGPLLEVEMSKKCTPLWREAHFEVKMHKAPFSDHFWKLRYRKNARHCGAKHISKSKCAKHTLFSGRFWKLRCRKSAHRCGAKHISKSKCTKHIILGPLLEVAMSKKCTPLWREAHTILGPLLEVEMSKKCTPLWREAHFEVKMLKALGVRTTFGSSDVHLAKSEQNVRVLWHFQLQPPLHHTTLQYTTTTPSLHSTTLHSTTLHYTTLNYTQFHYTTLHYTTLHYTTLHYTTLHYLPLHYTTLHYTTLHSTTLQLQLHSTTLHYTPLHSTTLHYTPLR